MFVKKTGVLCVVKLVRERTLTLHLDFKLKSNIVYIRWFPFFIYYLAVSLLISNGV